MHQIIQNPLYRRKVTHSQTLNENDAEIFNCKFDPEDRYLAAGCGDGIIRIFNMDSGKVAFRLAGQPGVTHEKMKDEMPITGLRWRP